MSKSLEKTAGSGDKGKGDYRVHVLFIVLLSVLVIEVFKPWQHWSGLHGTETSQITAGNGAVEESLDSNYPEIFTFDPIDINYCDRAVLMTVPGIGADLSGKIIQYRVENGGFASFSDLEKVPGIGPKRIEQFRSYLCVKEDDVPKNN